MKNSNSDGLLLILAIFAVVVSVVATGLTYLSVEDYTTKISGFVLTGEANLSVESSVVVNFTTRAINWGSGRVNVGSTSAALSTVGAGSVANGNWTAQTGLILENIGNVNVTMNLSGSKTAASFLGGTSPMYKWNISNSEANSCVNSTGGLVSLDLDTFHDVNTTVGASLTCPTFQFKAASDQIRIDFNISISEDATSGAKGDVITATIWTP